MRTRNYLFYLLRDPCFSQVVASGYMRHTGVQIDVGRRFIRAAAHSFTHSRFCVCVCASSFPAVVLSLVSLPCLRASPSWAPSSAACSTSSSACSVTTSTRARRKATTEARSAADGGVAHRLLRCAGALDPLRTPLLAMSKRTHPCASARLSSNRYTTQITPFKSKHTQPFNFCDRVQRAQALHESRTAARELRWF